MRLPSSQLSVFLCAHNLTRVGIFISSVTRGGLADSCGVTEGMKVVEINGENIVKGVRADVTGVLKRAKRVVLVSLSHFFVVVSFHFFS